MEPSSGSTLHKLLKPFTEAELSEALARIAPRIVRADRWLNFVLAQASFAPVITRVTGWGLRRLAMNAAPQRRSMGTVRLSGSLVQWRTEVFLAWTASDPRRSSASTSHAPGFFEF